MSGPPCASSRRKKNFIVDSLYLFILRRPGASDMFCTTVETGAPFRGTDAAVVARIVSGGTRETFFVCRPHAARGRPGQPGGTAGAGRSGQGGDGQRHPLRVRPRVWSVRFPGGAMGRRLVDQQPAAG